MGGTASSLVTAGAIVGGKYRLDALIGEGGMGSVWAATHLGLNQAVAIKFVSREFVRSAEALRRFDAEAKAAAALRSRHVVQVFDTGALADETPYIAMELLHGETLQARIHRGGPVPVGEAVEILSQCCKALGRAHAAGIIHRDIKPDNIFLAHSNDDDSYLVKVLDFGVAKMGAGPNEQGSQGATRTGAVLGTPLYMSPEQARGLKTIDNRTDLYSLGLVGYTMLTGNLAFSSESFGDLLLKICTAPLPGLCANAPWLPASMDGWFQRACAREPQDRFASAQELADALRSASGVAQAHGPSLAEVPAAAPGMHAGVPALASSAGTSPGISRTGDSFVVPGQGKRRAGIVIAVTMLALLGAGITAVLVTLARGARGPAHATANAEPSGTLPSMPAAATLVPMPIEPSQLDAPSISSGSAQQPSRPSQIEKPISMATAPPHTAMPHPSANLPSPPHVGTGPSPRPAATIDLGY
jgi:eukaryotic-like serine/threonine-protein kinase